MGTHISHVHRSRMMTFARNWLRPEVYPIMFFIGSACSWSIYVGVKMFTENPDVSVRKRHHPLNDKYGEGPGVHLFTESLVSSRVATEDNFRDSSKFRIF